MWNARALHKLCFPQRGWEQRTHMHTHREEDNVYIYVHTRTRTHARARTHRQATELKEEEREG